RDKRGDDSQDAEKKGGDSARHAPALPHLLKIRSGHDRPGSTELVQNQGTPCSRTSCRGLVFTPKALHSAAQGRASAPWETEVQSTPTPKGLDRGCPLCATPSG